MNEFVNTATIFLVLTLDFFWVWLRVVEVCAVGWCPWLIYLYFGFFCPQWYLFEALFPWHFSWCWRWSVHIRLDICMNCTIRLLEGLFIKMWVISLLWLLFVFLKAWGYAYNMGCSFVGLMKITLIWRSCLMAWDHCIQQEHDLLKSRLEAVVYEQEHDLCFLAWGHCIWQEHDLLKAWGRCI